MYIFDIDGTLSDPRKRLHLIQDYTGKKIDSPNWDQFLDDARYDEAIPAMVKLIRELHKTHHIVLSTGRREDQREMTQIWLKCNGIRYDLLIMRPTGDHRSDTIVKPEQLLIQMCQEVHPIPAVITIFEDRKRVTKAWRDLGYHVCQVAEGDY
jgi:uncharacterized HAD superfamily protein